MVRAAAAAEERGDHRGLAGVGEAHDARHERPGPRAAAAVARVVLQKLHERVHAQRRLRVHLVADGRVLGRVEGRDAPQAALLRGRLERDDGQARAAERVEPLRRDLG